MILNCIELKRLEINDYMKRFIDLNIENFKISLRLINHSNEFEKNTILTYLSLKSPDIVLNEFKKFISEKHQNMNNKESLFSNLEKEIKKSDKLGILDKLHENPITDYFNRNFSDDCSDGNDVFSDSDLPF